MGEGPVVERGGVQSLVVPDSVIGGADIAMGGGVSAPSVPEIIAPPPLCGPGVGILGESFQGIPPLGREDVDSDGSGVGSLPALAPWVFRSGGSIVRAVSIGAGSRVAGFAAGLISLPQPRQNL